MKAASWICALALLAAAPAAAQPAPPDRAARADALFSAMTPDRPGAVVAVARGGELVYARAFGAADLEQRTPITMATRFHVASISKQFTAFAVALLAREGKIDLGADIRTYLPELPDFGTPITVAQLLHHTSGLRDQWDLFVLSGTDMQSHLRQGAIFSLLRNQRALNFAPGTEYRYSNSGYSLAAEIVAQVSGMPFRRFVEERIFAPLGMGDSLIYDNSAEIVPGRAQSYRLTPAGTPEIVRLNYNNYGATSMITTAGDLLKWSRELLQPRVFDAALIGSLSRPVRLADGTALDYGFGMYRTPVAGRPAIMHGGADAGFRAIIASFPAEDASIVILSNGVADVTALNEALVDIFLNPTPRPNPVATPQPAELARLAGYYVASWGPGIELAVEGGELVRIAGGPRQAATFRPDGTFEFRTPTLRYRATSAGIEELPVIGPPLPYRRTERAAASAADLAALAGDYRSRELDVTYTLSVRGSQLVLTSLRAPEPILLVPGERDRFDMPFGTIGIVRGPSGRASGLSVTTGRVRDLRFDRVS